MTNRLFLEADGSTIFLDEIADLRWACRRNSCGSCRRKRSSSGQTKTLKVDVRVLAATNQDLEAKMARGIPGRSFLPSERDDSHPATLQRSRRIFPAASIFWSLTPGV